MTNYLVYIDGQLIDLPQGTSIAKTVQGLEIGDITGRSISYTNKIKVNRTERNEEVMKRCGFESVESTFPYQAHECKVVANGVEILPFGVCYVRRASQDTYEIDIFDASLELFRKVDGSLLKDLKLFGVSAWNKAAVDSYRSATTGIVSAVNNYGKTGAIYQYPYFLPSFYYHTFITAILGLTGLELEGNILAADDFKKLAFTFPDIFEYPKEFLGANDLKDIQSTNVTETGVAITGAFTQHRATQLGFTVPADVVGKAVVNIKVTLDIDSVNYGSPAAGSLLFGFFINGTIAILYPYTSGVYASNTIITSPATSSLTTNEYPIAVQAGDVVTVDIYGAGATNTGMSWRVKATTSFIEVSYKQTVDLENVVWEEFEWMKTKCVDFLKDFIIRYGIIPRQVGNKLVLKTIQEVISDITNADDWSSKGRGDSNDLDFKSNYAKENQFNYSNEKTNNESLGRGLITIADDSLEELKELYKTIFENSETIQTGSYKVLNVPVFDASSTTIQEMVDSPGFRLFTIKDVTTEPAITFDSVSRSTYKLGYFNDALLARQTSFDYFISIYYPLIIDAIRKNKTATRFYYLNEVDIASYHVHKMIHDRGKFYIVNLINAYVPDQLTKVELFKVL